MPQDLAIRNLHNTVGLLCDFVEEGWHSMDLSATMLYEYWSSERIKAELFCPTYRELFGRIPLFKRKRIARNADRLLNRFGNYAWSVRQMRRRYDLFHICDHTYAHLVHELPGEQTGVFCHDLDAFRSIIEPQRERRPWWYRRLAQRILTGLQKARLVFHTTDAVRREIERFRLIDPNCLVKAPMGVAVEFSTLPNNNLPDAVCQRENRPYILHVGSCIPRKRIDVLLNVFAEISREYPDVYLVKVGGPWSLTQQEQIERLGLRDRIVQLQGLNRSELAALYQSSTLVLMPSESEGFGIPIIEALACGARVVASDLEVFQEVGGEAVTYCRMGEVADWVSSVTYLLKERTRGPCLSTRLAQAEKYSWKNHAKIISEAYEGVLGVV